MELGYRKSSYFSRSVVAVLCCVAVLVAVQVSASGYSKDGPFDPLIPQYDDEKSVAMYAGVLWGLDEVRLSPKDPQTGIVTLIAEVTLTNNSNKSGYVIALEDVQLVNARNSEVDLDRFANTESEEYVYIEAGESKAVTLPFKFSDSEPNIASWSIKIQENQLKQPTLIPLEGDPESFFESWASEPIKYQFADSSLSFETTEIKSINHYRGTQAAFGKKYLYTRLQIKGDSVSSNPNLVDVNSWYIEADNRRVPVKSLRQWQYEGDLLVELVFDIDLKQDRGVLWFEAADQPIMTLSLQ